eukprot:g19121.t2
MQERSLFENMKHVLVSYSVEFEEGSDPREAAAGLAAAASTGVGADPRTKWPPLAESLGAVVYQFDPEEQELRVAFSVALFDRSFLDGSVRRSFSLRPNSTENHPQDLPTSAVSPCPRCEQTVRISTKGAVSRMSGGSLLRLFRSEYFDAHLHMHYLLRMEQSGVQDYLVNELYKMTDDDVEA